MPEGVRSIVTNTTPLIALVAATGNLEILRFLYDRVVVPYEVAQEVRAGGRDAFAVEVFERCNWLELIGAPSKLASYLENSLDRGEASVIQAALDHGVKLVCIDEVAGRRVARLSGLRLTGTIGVLIKAFQRGYPVSIPNALDAMRARGIWLGADVVRYALEQARSPIERR